MSDEDTTTAEPTMMELNAAWLDVLRELPTDVVSRWRGSWKLQNGAAVFVVPNRWHKAACDESRREVQNQLWVHGVDVSVEVVTADEWLLGEGEPDPQNIEGSTEEYVAAALGRAMQQARKKSKFSQRELGERVGVDQTAISSWERGAATPGIDRVFHLDLAFGLQPGTLLVRAGLIKPGAIEAAVMRAGEETPANVTKVGIRFDNDAWAELELPPALPTERWLEMVRTMLGNAPVAAVTRVTVSPATNGDDSSMRLPPGEYSLQEVLRFVEVMIEAQGDYVRADPDDPATYRQRVYDPAEEPF